MCVVCILLLHTQERGNPGGGRCLGEHLQGCAPHLQLPPHPCGLVQCPSLSGDAVRRMRVCEDQEASWHFSPPCCTLRVVWVGEAFPGGSGHPRAMLKPLLTPCLYPTAVPPLTSADCGPVWKVGWTGWEEPGSSTLHHYNLQSVFI